MTRFLTLLLVSLVGGCSGGCSSQRAGQTPHAPEQQVAVVIDDGNRNSRRLLLLDQTGRELELLAVGDIGGPAWSPDGELIAYHRQDPWEILVMKPGSSARRLLPDFPHPHRSLAWSPDGQRIAFVADLRGNLEVFLADKDGANPRNLSLNSAADDFPAWSPDGEKIAYSSQRSHAPRLYVANRDGTEPQDLLGIGVDGQLSPAWSPDGRWIAFNATASDGSIQLFVVRSDGSIMRQLTRGGAFSRYPSWSPCGRMVAYLQGRFREDGTVAHSGNLMFCDFVRNHHLTILSSVPCSHFSFRPAWKPAVRKPR